LQRLRQQQLQRPPQWLRQKRRQRLRQWLRQKQLPPLRQWLRRKQLPRLRRQQHLRLRQQVRFTFLKMSAKFLYVLCHLQLFAYAPQCGVL
jgi:hypothetical protein